MFYQVWYCHVLYDEKGNEKKVDENSWQAVESHTFYCNKCFSPAEEIGEK